MDVYLFQQINGLTGHNLFIDRVLTLCAQYLPIVFILFLAGFWLTRQHKLQRAALLAAVSGLLALGIAQIINGIVQRPRPYMYELHLLVARTADTSFPSDHATLAFAVTTLIWQFNRKWALVFLGLACLQGFARVYVGAHYPSDVLGGALLGILTSLVVGRVSALPSMRRFIDGFFSWLPKWSLAVRPTEVRASEAD